MPYVTDYATLANLKARLHIPPSDTNDDTTLGRLITVASRQVDAHCKRRFGQETTAVARYYTPTTPYVVIMHDVSTLAGLLVAEDRDGLNTFGTNLTVDVDFHVEPYNADLDGRPFTRIVAFPPAPRRFPIYTRSVRITGRWGWFTVPAEVTEATEIMAARLFRLAPLGVVSGDSTFASTPFYGLDPDAAALVANYRRTSYGGLEL